jgi:spermidine synthase
MVRSSGSLSLYQVTSKLPARSLFHRQPAHPYAARMRRARRAYLLAPLMFGSGLCALVYQIAWFREFRLIFGASTGSTAAVLAVFIGGLGAGGLVLGKRADRHASPIAMYANLELAIALSAAATPWLLSAARFAYLRLGGTPALGSTFGTALRLLLAALVLATPTFFMGGTLPAAARGAESEDDVGRREVGLLYGANTLGAVTGSVLATFLMLEVFGTRLTLWIACLLNLLIAVIARPIGRSFRSASANTAPTNEPCIVETPAWFTLIAAAGVGFAFFLMEMVWYRMLGPILGGTVFTFGLILAWALLGIGLGGAAYAFIGRRKPATLLAFAYTCLIEAACMLIPYALGDRIAVLALFLRPLGNVGFVGYLAGWSVVTALMVLPAAFLAGLQFPMLIALLGHGRESIGKQIGAAYAANTAGAIVGSLAGGFGLLPLLSATGCWRLVGLLLVLLGAVAAALVWRKVGPARVLAPALLGIAVVLLANAEGPTAAWRHTPIGSGRVPEGTTASSQALRDWLRSARRAVIWQRDGVESSVAIDASSGFSFVINGKADGHVRMDAATQVMSGLLGGLLRPGARHAMVIGLGTGSTAGWMAKIPSMERVDVVEFEPAILAVARMCAAVNRDVMDNPKVQITLGDAREVLLTSREHYDIIFSEPSNPYRAGIASLFTQEYYRAAQQRLQTGGVFLQWVQAYDIDAETLRTIYATLVSVFPHVATWELAKEDLLLVASGEPTAMEATDLAARLGGEPYREALASVWRTDSLEGLLSHHVATPDFARLLAQGEGIRLNTDDQNVVEFGFARSVGRRSTRGRELRQLAAERHQDRVAIDGQVNWARVDDEAAAFSAAEGYEPAPVPLATAEQRQRLTALGLYTQGRIRDALTAWRAQPQAPVGITETQLVAEGLAEVGDESALPLAAALQRRSETEAQAIVARLRMRQLRFADAATALEASFAAYRQGPWAPATFMMRTLTLAQEFPKKERSEIARVFAALASPFAASLLQEARLAARYRLATALPVEACVEAVEAYEPFFPWRREMLKLRATCYTATEHPRAAQARDELAELLASEPAFMSDGLPSAPNPQANPNP